MTDLYNAFRSEDTRWSWWRWTTKN